MRAGGLKSLQPIALQRLTSSVRRTRFSRVAQRLAEPYKTRRCLAPSALNSLPTNC